MCAADSELINIYLNWNTVFFSLYIIFCFCMHVFIDNLPSSIIRSCVYLEMREREREKQKEQKNGKNPWDEENKQNIYIRYRVISICITYCKRRAFIDFVFVSHFDFEKDLLKILLSLYHIVIVAFYIYIIIHQSFNLARFFNFTNSQYINFVCIFRAFHIRLHIEHPQVRLNAWERKSSVSVTLLYQSF